MFENRYFNAEDHLVSWEMRSFTLDWILTEHVRQISLRFFYRKEGENELIKLSNNKNRNVHLSFLIDIQSSIDIDSQNK